MYLQDILHLMQNPWRQFLDILWPANIETTNSVLAFKAPRTFQSTIFLARYQEPAIRQLIKTNKYQGNHASAQALAALLDTYLESKRPCTIIPIPSSTSRWRERGYYHLHAILAHSRYNQCAAHNILHKKKTTAPQTQVTREQRLTQQTGSFSCHPIRALQLRGTVILFDDVITTGATMTAARAELAPHLHPDTTLVCVALAH